jgi:hypothetical protein
MPTNITGLLAVKKMLFQVNFIITSTEFQDAARCRELMNAAIALTDDMLKQEKKLPAARILGSKGGSVTAKRGSEYFRQLAAKRKTNAGGRPRKES